MSHEIRTPLNAVVGMSGLLQHTRLDAEQHGYCDTIRSSCESLLAVINDILDYSKIESGRLVLETQPFSLRDCIDDALDLVSQRAGDKGLDLCAVVDDGCVDARIGDATRVRQVLVNLLANAVKFTPAGEVVLTAHCQGTGGETVVLAVRDTGIGIPADKLPALFQSFTQVDASTTRRYGGTGLGLAIVRQLVEAMAGSIGVASEPGAGSTFTVTLPLRRHGEALRADDGGSHAELQHKRVLVVDDNATVRQLLVRQLGGFGMLPHAAASAEEALQQLQQQPFDLAILDLRMPDVDGVALAARLRDLPHGRTLPLVLMASFGQYKAAAGDVPFAAIASKPVKPLQLQRLLRPLFAGSPAAPAPRPSCDLELARQLPLRILVVDDNQLNVKVACNMLARMGYRPDVAGNGVEAVAACARQPYDLVLMDVHMPDMDGFEATQKLRALALQPQPWVVAVTANAMDGDREQCLHAGMDDYLAKPCRLEDLRAALHRAAAAGRAAPPTDALAAAR